MQADWFDSERNWREPPDRHACRRPCRGVLVEEIHSRSEERFCYQGVLKLCALPVNMVSPLELRRVDVVCIAPEMSCCAFRLTLRCEVADCRGRTACGEAMLVVSPRHLNRCGAENLHLGARVDVQQARFCAPSSFWVCAQLLLVAVTTGPAKMMCHRPEKPCCAFLPLYPSPMCRKGGLFLNSAPENSRNA